MGRASAAVPVPVDCARQGGKGGGAGGTVVGEWQGRPRTGPEAGVRPRCPRWTQLATPSATTPPVAHL